MNVQIIDGAVVISGLDQAGGAEAKTLAPSDFTDKSLVVQTEPAFYVALDANGHVIRSVSVTVEDRKVVAALVGNWIAEGFQPIPCDLKNYMKHLRATAKAKAALGEGTEANADTL